MFRVSMLHNKDPKYTHAAVAIDGVHDTQAGKDVEALVDADQPVLICSSLHQASAMMNVPLSKIKKPRGYKEDVQE